MSALNNRRKVECQRADVESNPKNWHCMALKHNITPNKCSIAFSSNGYILSLFQDRFLPIANVARIMKKAIPNNGKISKEAKECAQECVSEFISFITSEASDRCSQEKRKTINGEDILYAMSTLGFDNYVEPLKVYLSKYREVGS